MTALTRTDLSNHIRAMPPKSRGRRTLELFAKTLTTEELKEWNDKREAEEEARIHRECVDELWRVLPSCNYPEVI